MASGIYLRPAFVNVAATKKARLFSGLLLNN
jgi:hypothetical protein